MRMNSYVSPKINTVTKAYSPCPSFVCASAIVRAGGFKLICSERSTPKGAILVNQGQTSFSVGRATRETTGFESVIVCVPYLCGCMCHADKVFPSTLVFTLRHCSLLLTACMTFDWGLPFFCSFRRLMQPDWHTLSLSFSPTHTRVDQNAWIR